MASHSRKKGQHTPHAPIGDVRDPESLYHYLQRFLAWLAERQYSPKTIVNREELLRVFIAWLDERGIRRPQEVTKPIIERYQSHLFVYRKKDGQPLSARTQHGHITPIRAWFKWLAKQNFILYNPASDLDLPRLDRRLPRSVLTVKEAETVLAVPDVQTPTGIRDRAMLEVLYSTGMRRMELMQLQVFDLDAERGTVLIRLGKGKKDRMVPIGERAIAWVEKYRDDVRPELAAGADDGTLFLTHLGEAFTPNRLTQLVREYVQAAEIGKSGSCHLFRHTMATLMLENGADIRYIQAILGHAELSTTQIYTQVSIRQLKAIHSATHPARLPGSIAGAAGPRAGAAVSEPQPVPLNAAAALLMALDAEAEDEAGAEQGSVAADAWRRR
ncbi:MAG: site-specific tyrosine recombinase XerC [Burkholderiales bacterium]|nr:site-specific tyrosine recombinase XerC [Burkholderiales bacterium]